MTIMIILYVCTYINWQNAKTCTRLFVYIVYLRTYFLDSIIKVKDGDKMGTAATRAKNKWQKQNVDRVNLTMPKGKKEQIQAHAQVCGESVNGFINRAISEAMERDNAAPGPAEGLADTEGGDA